jgi:YbbR domain-containing protein
MGRRLVRFVLEDWGLKLLSLGFATLLWMFVVGGISSEKSLSLPLELTRVPEKMVIVSRVPEAIDVRLSGPQTLLAATDLQHPVTLDLEGIQPGISSFEIPSSRLNLPRGIEVTFISPSVITLEADLKAKKIVPLKPRIKGTPADGFEVAELKMEPPEVEVEGAARVLKQLREIPTEVVDVVGLEGSVTRPVELALPDPSLRRVDKNPVKLEVVVRELRAEREFIELPVATPGPEWVTDPPSVNIKLEGTLLATSRLKARDVVALLEPFGDAPPKGPVRVVVKVPAGIQILAVEPAEVGVAPSPEPEPKKTGEGSTRESTPKNDGE